MILFRSVIFSAAFACWTGLCSFGFLLLRSLGWRWSWPLARLWSRGTIALLRAIVGAKVEIRGQDRLPSTPCVVLAKHQSALETIVMPLLGPPFVWVLKRELLWIPLFGWALWAADAIAINRKHPRKALAQVIRKGKEFLRKGRWVVIFPEGTRVPVGKEGRYQASGVLLAREARVPIVLVAVATGHIWPRGGLRKYPGRALIEVIGEIPKERVLSEKKEALLAEIKQRIEKATRALEREAQG